MDVEELKAIAKELRQELLRLIHAAGSGHPGGSLSAIDILTVLFFHEMSYDAANPEEPGRDRFILSKGHATPAYYTVLARAGFFPREELKRYRRTGGMLEGHPSRKIPGVEISTGSLGQGLSVGHGIALCGMLDRRHYRVYVMLGDGELQEGQVWEAVMSAGYRKTNSLVAIVDHNRIAQDNTIADLKEVEPLDQKFASFGWHVLRINGHDMKEILQAFKDAREVKDKPVVIIAETIKGKGVSFMENKAAWHGKAPDDAQLAQALAEVSESG